MKHDAMTYGAKAGDESVPRFRDAALPYIDDAYTLAHFLMRNQADAEDTVQECYLRAQRRFDSFRGSAMKPWLLAILRNLCHATLAGRNRCGMSADLADGGHAVGEPSLWRQSDAPPDPEMLSRQDGAMVRRLIVALPLPLREAIVLREFNGMSYREIAEVVSAPVETVMSRLARARAMLLWKAADSRTMAVNNPAHGTCEYAS